MQHCFGCIPDLDYRYTPYSLLWLANAFGEPSEALLTLSRPLFIDLSLLDHAHLR